MTRTRPIKIAVVGLGRAGWDIHVRRLRGNKRFVVSAVADELPERCEEARRELGCAAFPDLKSLLRKAEAEVVVIATRSIDHGPMTIAALRSGRHVICEKPMAMNTAEGRLMIRAAERANLKLFIHHNYRYQPDFRHLMEVIRKKVVGDVFEIRIRLLGFARRNDWQTLRKYGGGVLNNTGPHFVDIALNFLGAPVAEVLGDLKHVSDAGDVEDHVKILIRGANGRIIDLEISTSCNTVEPKWTVLGTCGTLTSDGVTSTIKRFDRKKIKPLPVREEAPPNRSYGNDDVLPWVEEMVPSRAEVNTDFYDNVFAVLRWSKAMDIPPDQALEVVRVTELAKRGTGFEW